MQKVANGLIAVSVSLGVLSLALPRHVFAHGKELVKKGSGPAAVELGRTVVRSLISAMGISNWFVTPQECCRSIASTPT